MTRKDLTQIAVVLDKSGSMLHLKAATLAGFGDFLETQKRLPGEARMTLVQFNTNYEVSYRNAPLTEVKLDYWPDGWTALLDAVGRAISEVGEVLAKTPEKERPGKVVFVIITDGQENSSHEYTRKQVLDMITHQREKYGWEFIFMGANMDAVAEAKTLGINPAFAANYTASQQGTQSTYGTISSSVSRIRSGKSGALTDEEREKLNKG